MVKSAFGAEDEEVHIVEGLCVFRLLGVCRQGPSEDDNINTTDMIAMDASSCLSTPAPRCALLRFALLCCGRHAA